jgi:hypothetical protein
VLVPPSGKSSRVLPTFASRVYAGKPRYRHRDKYRHGVSEYRGVQVSVGKQHDGPIVPGLLQTEEYARTVLKYDRNSPLDVEERLRTRLERQRIFDRDDPPTTVFIMNEHVLHQEVGGPEVMSGQLLHLVELAEQPNVIIQIVPASAGYHPGLVGAFMIAKFDGIEVAFQDGTITGHVLEDRDQVSAFSRVWENIRALALPRAASIELIAKVAEQWKF